jgi:hypothetical protein
MRHILLLFFNGFPIWSFSQTGIFWLCPRCKDGGVLFPNANVLIGSVGIATNSNGYFVMLIKGWRVQCEHLGGWILKNLEKGLSWKRENNVVDVKLVEDEFKLEEVVVSQLVPRVK